MDYFPNHFVLPSDMVVCIPDMRGGGGGTQQHNLEPAKLSSYVVHTTDQSYMGFQHDQHQVDSPPLCSQFPTYDSNIVSCQYSGDNFSTDSTDQTAGSNFHFFRDTLQSLVESQLCSTQNYSSSSSSGNSDKLRCNKPFSHDQNMLVAENAALELPVPSDENQGLNACDGSSSQAERLSKNRIKWTKDLDEQFVKCVNCLGGAKKATPKAILKLMNTNLLTILHVKSHLQKYRTTGYMAESVQEKSPRITRRKGMPPLQMKLSRQMRQAVQLELDVEKHLHEQLELQQNLQLLIEEQQRQLTTMFEQQQKMNKSLFKSRNSDLSSQNET